jgi:imidazolonepropionase-like amidohydrolase
MSIRTIRRFGFIALPVVLLASLAGIWVALQPPRLEVPGQGAFTIRDVTLINPLVDRREHVDIRIENGIVRSVLPGDGTQAPGDVVCPGCFALPGLMDMHAHMPPRAAIGNDRLFALMFLAHGVTMIREVGSPDGGTYTIRDALAAGEYPGPRMVSCGYVLDGDPPTRPNNFVIRTPEEARAAVAEAAAQGARCLKLYNMISRDVVLAIAHAAAKAGLRIIAHVPHSVSLLYARYIADVQHYTGVPVPADPAAVGRDDYLNDDFAALTDARIAEVVKAALANGTIHTPALVNERVRRTLADPVRFPPDPAVALLPAFWETVWRKIWEAPNAGPEREAVYEGFLARERVLTRALFDAGATIYAGTDTLMPFVAPGAALHEELRQFLETGVSPERALATATTASGQFWPGYTYGRVDVGLPADIVLYRADPTASLDALRTMHTVIADGRIYPRQTLDGWLRQYGEHFRSAVYEGVMGSVVNALAKRYDP